MTFDEFAKAPLYALSYGIAMLVLVLPAFVFYGILFHLKDKAKESKEGNDGSDEVE